MVRKIKFIFPILESGNYKRSENSTFLFRNTTAQTFKMSISF